MSKEIVKIVHIADTHIDPTARYLGHKEQDRRRDFIMAFNYAINKTLELKPDILLISGDLYDKVNPRNPARTHVIRAFRRLYHEGIKIYAISGNHDTPRSLEEGASPLHEIDAAGYIRYFSKSKEMESDIIDIHGIKVCISGASYNHSIPFDRDPLEMLSIPCEGDLNIAMLHYNFTSFNIPSFWRAPTIKETSLPQDLHYLALGHYHSFKKVCIGNTYVVYPGSTERVTFLEENEPKGFVYLELYENGVREVNYIQTEPRPLKTLDITITKNDPNPIGKIVSIARQHSDPKVILRLRIKGKLSLERLMRYSREDVLKELEKYFFHVIINDQKLEYLLETPEIESFELLSPIKLYEEYFAKLIEEADKDNGKKEILLKALNLGKKFLEEAGAW